LTFFPPFPPPFFDRAKDKKTARQRGGHFSFFPCAPSAYQGRNGDDELASRTHLSTCDGLFSPPRPPDVAAFLMFSAVHSWRSEPKGPFPNCRGGLVSSLLQLYRGLLREGSSRYAGLRANRLTKTFFSPLPPPLLFSVLLSPMNLTASGFGRRWRRSHLHARAFFSFLFLFVSCNRSRRQEEAMVRHLPPFLLPFSIGNTDS